MEKYFNTPKTIAFSYKEAKPIKAGYTKHFDGIEFYVSSRKAFRILHREYGPSEWRYDEKTGLYRTFWHLRNSVWDYFEIKIKI